MSEKNSHSPMTQVKPTEQYLRYLREGRFMIQRSAFSREHIFYPRVAAPRSGVRDLEWVEASGRGTVYSTTVQRSKPPAPDINVALIELEEGPRMLSRVVGASPADVKIGMAVNARIVEEESGPFIVFELAQKK